MYRSWSAPSPVRSLSRSGSDSLLELVNRDAAKEKGRYVEG